MKAKTGKLLKTYYLIVEEILERFSDNKKLDKVRLNKAFKAFYSREYQVNRISLKDFEQQELNTLINRILIEFSVEYGIYLKQPNDPEGAEDLSLSEYFEYINWSMQNITESQKGLSTLPEGFHLIEDLEELKTLKKGKRTYKAKNLTWNHGLVLYIFSHRENKYYQKTFSPLTPMEKVTEYINKKILYGPPSTQSPGK